MTPKNILDELLPRDGWIREYVDANEPLTEAPAEAHLATGLAVLSAAVGWKAFINWGRSAEPCTLFVVIEGESAIAKKTTTIRTAADLVRAAMNGVDDDEAMSVRTMGHTSQKGLIEMVATTDEAKAKRWEQVPPPGVILDWDEFGSVLGKPGDVKSSDYLGHVRATLMQMFGGRHGGIQTGGSKIPPGRCSVAMMATLTRQELEDRVTTGLLRDGFLGRFVLIPNPGRTRYLPEPPARTPLDYQRQDRLADFLRKVATSKQEVGDVFSRMTPAAREFRRAWYQSRMPELDEAARNGGEVEVAMADVMSRLQTTALKVAAVLAVSRMHFSEDLGEVKIEADDVKQGIAFAERAMAEVGDLARIGGSMPTDAYAEKVIEYVKRYYASENGHGPLPPMTRKMLMENVRGPNLDAAARWKVVERMHEQGDLVVAIEPAGDGRKRARFIVSLP